MNINSYLNYQFNFLLFHYNLEIEALSGFYITNYILFYNIYVINYINLFLFLFYFIINQLLFNFFLFLFLIFF